MENQIAFRIIGVEIESFTYNPKDFMEGKNSTIVTDIQFKADSENHQIASFSTFTFNCESKPFIVITLICHFEIAPNSWEDCYVDATMKFPMDFMTHLAIMSVGTARGVIHTKTEGKFLLPTINVKELVKEDVVFTFEN